MAVGKGRPANQGRSREGTKGGPKKILAPPVLVHGATHHRNRGRQGAVDKKRGRNPVKQTASSLATGQGRVRRKLPPAGLSFPLRNKKPQFPAGGN